MRSWRTRWVKRDWSLFGSKAIESVATGNRTAEQAVDEAIARVKQILSE